MKRELTILVMVMFSLTAVLAYDVEGGCGVSGWNGLGTGCGLYSYCPSHSHESSNTCSGGGYSCCTNYGIFGTGPPCWCCSDSTGTTYCNCDSDYYPSGGECLECGVDGCCSDSDCSSGEYCSGHSCVTCDTAACSSHSSNCWDGVTPFCDEDSDCTDTSRCNGGIYQTRSVSCTSSCSCSYGSWVDGTETQSVQYCGAECDEDNDCGSGAYCRDASCVVCTSSDCNAHASCRDGTVGCCDESSDCGTGDYCKQSNHQCESLPGKTCVKAKTSYGYTPQDNDEDLYDECSPGSWSTCTQNGCEKKRKANGYCAGGSYECDDDWHNQPCLEGSACLEGDCSVVYCDDSGSCGSGLNSDTYYRKTCDGRGACSKMVDVGCCEQVYCSQGSYCDTQSHSCTICTTSQCDLSQCWEESSICCDEDSDCDTNPSDWRDEEYCDLFTHTCKNLWSSKVLKVSLENQYHTIPFKLDVGLKDTSGEFHDVSFNYFAFQTVQNDFIKIDKANDFVYFPFKRFFPLSANEELDVFLNLEQAYTVLRNKEIVECSNGKARVSIEYEQEAFSNYLKNEDDDLIYEYDVNGDLIRTNQDRSIVVFNTSVSNKDVYKTSNAEEERMVQPYDEEGNKIQIGSVKVTHEPGSVSEYRSFDNMPVVYFENGVGTPLHREGFTCDPVDKGDDTCYCPYPILKTTYTCPNMEDFTQYGYNLDGDCSYKRSYYVFIEEEGSDITEMVVDSCDSEEVSDEGSCELRTEVVDCTCSEGYNTEYLLCESELMNKAIPLYEFGKSKIRDDDLTNNEVTISIPWCLE